MAIARGELVGELLDGQTQIFHEAASLHLLNREATRYQELFSVCLLRPDGPHRRQASEELERVRRRVEAATR
jgi:hypothetical protein